MNAFIVQDDLGGWRETFFVTFLLSCIFWQPGVKSGILTIFGHILTEKNE